MNDKGDQKMRVLVVDDSVVYRMMIADVLAGIPQVEVAGTAHNGAAALKKTASLKPDLVTLDIEMPDMDGLAVLTLLADRYPRLGVIMVSASAGEGRVRIIKALEAGAFDFIVKPDGKTMADNKEMFRRRIVPMVRSFARLWKIRSILNPPVASPSARTKDAPEIPGPNDEGTRLKKQRLPGACSRVVAMGVSTGGPVALSRVLPLFKGNLGVPILVVQHMPPVFTRALAESLDKKCEIRVREAVDGEPLLPGTAYIAPGGHHMKVVDAPVKGGGKLIRITDDPPENGCRPSVDYLFRSVSAHFGADATGVIMTGMGYDGADGVKQLKAKGATIIVQDEQSSTVFGMARRPMAWGIVDVVAPLDVLADEILGTVVRLKKKGSGSCSAPAGVSVFRKP